MSQAINWLKTTRGFITALTAVILVIPSLINGGLDIYRAVAKIPEGIQQKTNQNLFEIHFRDHPISDLPVDIKTSTGQLSMKLEIYENGDIYVTYGDFSQWFPFATPKASHAMDWISTAYAQDTKSAPIGRGSYTQSQKLKEGIVVRERVYSNDVKEVFHIDSQSGQILKKSSEKLEGPEKNPASSSPNVKVSAPFVIDIEAIKRQLRP